jgi:hypothetical protein
MRRLFTFGCSYTNYGWPTWADICGRSFNTFVNYGKSGAGNHYIVSTLLECDKVYNLTPDDVVLIMFTSPTRFDTLINGNWGTRGNIFTTNGYFDNKFLSEYWSEDYGVQTTWMHMKHAKLFLESKKIQHKMMSAFNLHMGLKSEYEYLLRSSSEKFNKYYDKDVSDILDVKISVREWIVATYGTRTSDYFKFKWNPSMKWCEPTNEIVDGHPTIQMHYDWVKKFLPEYLPNNFDVEKETKIHYDYDNYTPNHKICECCKENTGYIKSKHILWTGVDDE